MAKYKKYFFVVSLLHLMAQNFNYFCELPVALK